jgi:Gpi18-like mannosyltransferase
VKLIRVVLRNKPWQFSRWAIPQNDWFYCKRALTLALGIRLGVLVIAYIAGRHLLDRSTLPYELLHETLCRWDTIQYLAIAEHGYSNTKATEHLLGYFPLFPFLVKILSLVFRDYFVSSLLLSFVASVTAGYLLQKLAILDADDDAEADRALWYCFCFPTAYFLVLGYTESLFLALSLASFYFARKGKWLTCGSLAALTAATRANGIVLLPALIVEAFLNNDKRPSKSCLWLFLAPLGLLANAINSWVVSGNYWAYVEMQHKYFTESTVVPWNNLINLFQQYVNSAPSAFKTMTVEVVILSFGIVVALLVLSVRWLRISYQVYSWSQLTFILTASWIISFPRLILVVFPLFIILARLGRNQDLHRLLLIGTALCMGGLFCIFVTGRWAF